MKLTTAVVLSLSASGVASAEGSNWSSYASVGYAFEGTEGLEMELGAYYQFNDTFSLRASPLNIVLYDDPPEGFYTDTFSNGQSRCRNESNGQFADDSECSDVGLDWRGALEVQALLFDKVDVGVGALISEEFDPFGSVAYRFNNSTSLSARVGDNYASVAISFTFR